MNPSIRKSALFAATAAILALFPCAAFAATKVEVDKPKPVDLPSPQFAGVKGESWTPKDWLKIETRLKVAMIPEPKSKTCDTLTVKWHVAMDNPEKSGTYLKFTREVQHVNVPLGEDVYVCVFLSPASIRRLTGSDRAGKNSVKFIGVEVVTEGQTADAAEGKDKWWTMVSKSMSESAVVPLQSKAETPFAAAWWDRYAEEKPAAAGPR
ncbi:MAG: hypothetical protein RLZZ522_853 [Verrucomicrobiota bacterium]|jgi:hypothetical protein